MQMLDHFDSETQRLYLLFTKHKIIKYVESSGSFEFEDGVFKEGQSTKAIFRVCLFQFAGHNLAEVVSVHAYLCSERSSLIWVGEASLEYVQDDAQVLKKYVLLTYT